MDARHDNPPACTLTSLVTGAPIHVHAIHVSRLLASLTPIGSSANIATAHVKNLWMWTHRICQHKNRMNIISLARQENWLVLVILVFCMNYPESNSPCSTHRRPGQKLLESFTMLNTYTTWSEAVRGQVSNECKQVIVITGTHVAILWKDVKHQHSKKSSNELSAPSAATRNMKILNAG